MNPTSEVLDQNEHHTLEQMGYLLWQEWDVDTERAFWYLTLHGTKIPIYKPTPRELYDHVMDQEPNFAWPTELCQSAALFNKHLTKINGSDSYGV
jgi:hypothetical protein